MQRLPLVLLPQTSEDLYFRMAATLPNRRLRFDISEETLLAIINRDYGFVTKLHLTYYQLIAIA